MRDYPLTAMYLSTNGATTLLNAKGMPEKSSTKNGTTPV